MIPLGLVVALALAEPSAHPPARRAGTHPGKPHPAEEARDGGTTPLASEHPLDITADHLTVLTRENRSEWRGHVHVVRPAEEGKPPVHIRCDHMETASGPARDAGSRPGEGKLEQVVCTGNVEVVQGQQAGWGEKAVFDNTSGVLVVTGSPHAKDGDNRYSANLLTFYVDQNRLEMSGDVRVLLDPQKAGSLPGETSPRAKEPARTPVDAPRLDAPGSMP